MAVDENNSGYISCGEFGSAPAKGVAPSSSSLYSTSVCVTSFDSPLPSVFVSHRSDVTSSIWGFMLDTSSVYKKAVHTRQRAPINVRCATGAARPRGHAHDNRASGFRAAPARIVDARRRPPTALLRPVGGGCGTFGSVGATAWEASVGTASVAASAPAPASAPRSRALMTLGDLLPAGLSQHSNTLRQVLRMLQLPNSHTDASRLQDLLGSGQVRVACWGGFGRGDSPLTCGDLVCSRGLKKRRRKIPSGHCLCTRLTRTTSAPSKCASRVCCDPCCRWNRCATCSLSFTYGCAAVGVCVGRLLTWLAACYYSDSAQAGPQAGLLVPCKTHCRRAPVHTCGAQRAASGVSQNIGVAHLAAAIASSERSQPTTRAILCSGGSCSLHPMVSPLTILGADHCTDSPLTVWGVSAAFVPSGLTSLYHHK